MFKYIKWSMNFTFFYSDVSFSEVFLQLLPGGSVEKNPPAMQGTWSLGWEDSPGGGNGNPLQYSCLENSMDRGAWWATVCRVTGHDWATEHTYIHKHTQFSLKSAASYHPGLCFTIILEIPWPDSINIIIYLLYADETGGFKVSMLEK